MGRPLLDQVLHSEAALSKFADCWLVNGHEAQVRFGCEQALHQQPEARGLDADAEWLQTGSGYPDIFVLTSLHSHDF